MNDYRSIRCLHEGFTLTKLPADVDPRGPQEQAALHRAHTEQAWRKLRALAKPAGPPAPTNVIHFGSAAK